MAKIFRDGGFVPSAKKTIAAWFLLSLAAVAGLVLFSCDSKESTPEPVVTEYSRVIHIGLIPEEDVFSQKERYAPLASYLSRKSGVGIVLEVIPQYGDLISRFEPMGLDGAFFGSFTYALAHGIIPIEPVARPETPEGVSTYHGMIFVRKDSGIKTAAQMRGKRFAFVNRATTAGYLLPLRFFRDNGIMDYREYFSETYFTGTHEDAIYDVLNRRADIGAAKNTVFARLARTDPSLLDELAILARSPEVPENALALRSDIDGSVRGRIGDVLLGMDRDPEGLEILRNFGAARFIETSHRDYAPVYDYARAVGLDLQTFDWLDEQ